MANSPGPGGSKRSIVCDAMHVQPGPAVDDSCDRRTACLLLEGGQGGFVQIRYVLGLLLAFGAINAFAGGWYGLSGADGVPTEWLHGSPFADYFFPSLILIVAVGGTFAFAAWSVLARVRWGRVSALIAGGVVLGWIAAQLAIIGYVSWMQPATVTAGALIVVLARALPDP